VTDRRHELVLQAFDALALGDVADHDQARGRVRPFAFGDADLAHILPALQLDLRGLARVERKRQAIADQRAGAVVEQIHRRFVGELNDLLGVDDDDRVRGDRDQALELTMLREGTQELLRLPPLGLLAFERTQRRLALVHLVQQPLVGPVQLLRRGQCQDPRQ
jgi:hypothetical protein